jgi:ribosome maturation factor RimP
MITINRIRTCIEEELRRNDFFLVDIKVDSSNRIKVYVDSMKGITIDECAGLSRIIEEELDRDEEDFDLEVSSPGLDRPLVLPVQYIKNTGRQLEVLTTEGQIIKGSLQHADEEKIEIETRTGKKIQGKKKKEMVVKRLSLKYNEIRTAKVLVTF